MRRAFHLLSGSYVGYFLRKADVGRLMRIYSAKDAKAQIREKTGRPAAGQKAR